MKWYLDFGHGGKDPGAVGKNNNKESEVFLKTKLYLLGNKLCFSLSNNLNTPNRGLKTSNSFYVLKHTKIPALLIEIDFIFYSFYSA